MVRWKSLSCTLWIAENCPGTWGFPEVGPWHILSHSFQVEIGSPQSTKHRKALQAQRINSFCGSNWETQSARIEIGLRCVHLKVHGAILRSNLDHKLLGPRLHCLFRHPGRPRNEGFQRKTCWNLHGSRHFVKLDTFDKSFWMRIISHRIQPAAKVQVTIWHLQGTKACQNIPKYAYRPIVQHFFKFIQSI